ncbi:MAG TPA: winged helix-turn-helix domain-containing protein, partial [Clostridia bacterium]|nr:winged helix-turn-helix domain-containing protein [Clostridia bacterium]
MKLQLASYLFDDALRKGWDYMELLTFVFNDEGNETLYHQLYSHIKEEIETKRMKYNDKLPSKRKLANHLGISQNTIETAYGQLIQEGYITSIERKGYFVAKIDN